MTITLNGYQRWAQNGAKYPALNGQRLGYSGLAVASEGGEFADEVKKMFRDDDGVLTEERRQKMIKELGDVLWYVANAAKDLGLTLEGIAVANSDKLCERHPGRPPLIREDTEDTGYNWF